VFAALVVAGSALLVGSPSSSLRPPGSVYAAELVAAHFIGGFENFSYRHPLSSRALAGLATPPLAARLRSSPQAASGPELAAERFVATARVSGFAVENTTATGVRLLARTTEHISTTHGSTTTARLVPVSLTLTRSGWRVADVGGIQGVTDHAIRQRTVVPPAAPTGASPAVPDAVTVQDVRDVGAIPSNYLSWMQGAVAAECPGLPWEVLAGIAKVESDFGQSTLPGVDSGSNSAGAEGPMQFEPATFRAYATVAPGGADPASPYDAQDAVYSAARLLCADGGGTPGLLDTAIFDYNHSDAYVAMVLAYASAYQQGGGAAVQLTSATGSAQGIALGSVVVADAEAYLGTPYVWGGEKPGVGFDCSGLVQWVYAEAGISLPRVAQDQFDAGPHLPPGSTLYPGDLVFFGSGPQAVEHVGIYVGNGEMIDAPYTGVDVRFDRVSSVSLGYVGATRPEIPNLSTGAGVPVISSETADLLADATTSTRSPQFKTAADGAPNRRPVKTVGASTVSHPQPNRHTSPPGRTGPSSARPGTHRHTSAPTTTTTALRTTTSTTPSHRNPTTTTSTVPTHRSPTTTTTTQPPPTTSTTLPIRTPPTTVPPSTTTTTNPPPTTVATLPPATSTAPVHHRHR
jgi:cell wall-associated NlpC family hydrolase